MNPLIFLKRPNMHYVIRDHSFKTLANFHDFRPLPSAFQQNAYGDFWSLCNVTFWPSANGDTPPLLRHACLKYGWSLRLKNRAVVKPMASQTVTCKKLFTPSLNYSTKILLLAREYRGEIWMKEKEKLSRWPSPCHARPVFILVWWRYAAGAPSM